jgi:hypothetical protein
MFLNTAVADLDHVSYKLFPATAAVDLAWSELGSTLIAEHGWLPPNDASVPELSYE